MTFVIEVDLGGSPVVRCSSTATPTSLGRGMLKLTNCGKNTKFVTTNELSESTYVGVLHSYMANLMLHDDTILGYTILSERVTLELGGVALYRDGLGTAGD